MDSMRRIFRHLNQSGAARPDPVDLSKNVFHRLKICGLEKARSKPPGPFEKTGLVKGDFVLARVPEGVRAFPAQAIPAIAGTHAQRVSPHSCKAWEKKRLREYLTAYFTVIVLIIFYSIYPELIILFTGEIR